MKELIKPKKKRVVFEKVNAYTFSESPDGYYSQRNYYLRGGGSDVYTRGGDILTNEDILF